MKLTNVVRGALLAALCLAMPVAALAGQGWEVEYRSSTTDSDHPQAFILKMDDDHIRLTPVGEDAEIIITPDGFVVVNHDRNENMAMGFDDLQNAMSGISAAMKQAQAQLEEAKKTMSPEQIAAMEKFMPKLDDPGAAMTEGQQKFSYKKTKDKSDVAGLSTTKAEVYEEDELVGEVWLTTKIPVEPLVRAAERMIQTMPKEMRQNLELAEMFVGLDGFPLKLVNTDKNPHEVIEAVRADKKNFGGDTWKGPADYSNTSMADQMKFEMSKDR